MYLSSTTMSVSPSNPNIEIYDGGNISLVANDINNFLQDISKEERMNIASICKEIGFSFDEEQDNLEDYMEPEIEQDNTTPEPQDPYADSINEILNGQNKLNMKMDRILIQLNTLDRSNLSQTTDKIMDAPITAICAVGFTSVYGLYAVYKYLRR